MINLKDLKDNYSKILSLLETKGFKDEALLKCVFDKYNNYLVLLEEEKNTRNQLNVISKEISITPSDELKNDAKKLSEEAKTITNKISVLKLEVDTLALNIPNTPSLKTPLGKDEKENKEIETFGETKVFGLPHWEILERKNLVDEMSKDISGARQVIYKNDLAKLIMAIEFYILSKGIKEEINLSVVPVIVNEQSLLNTGQLPKFKDDLFQLENGKYLIPTGEVPLTNLAMNNFYKVDELPISNLALSNCFRKEAGSAGKDTRGIIRLHQFKKIEMVTFGKVGEEKHDFNKILKFASSILDDLNIPYRYVELCTGDLPFSSKYTIDIEVWMPGSNEYREISSVSFLGDFQARRMNARYKDTDSNKHFINTFNGSALAIDRLVAAILENYYIEDEGKVKIPKVLKNLVNNDSF